MKEEIGLLSIMDNLVVLENGKRYSIEKYIDNLQQRINKAIKVINTQMKSADDGIKENLRIIKFNLIKGECRVCDLKTEEDYKY